MNINGLRWRCCWYCGPPDLNTVGLKLKIVCSKCGISPMFATDVCCSTYWPFNSLEFTYDTYDIIVNFLFATNQRFSLKMELAYDPNWSVRVLESIVWSTHHLSCIINFLPLQRHEDEIIVIYLVVFPLMNRISESRSTLKK